MVFFQSMPSSTVQSSASPHLFSHFKAEALHCCLIKLWFLQGHQHTGSINSVDRHVPYFDLEKNPTILHGRTVKCMNYGSY